MPLNYAEDAHTKHEHKLGLVCPYSLSIMLSNLSKVLIKFFLTPKLN